MLIYRYISIYNYLEESFGSPESIKILLKVQDIELGAALDLIKGLTADLRGAIQLDTSSGTRIQIDFKIDQLAMIKKREALAV